MYGRDRHLPPKLIGTLLIMLLVAATWLAQPVLGTAPSGMPQARPTLPSGGSGTGNGSGLADSSCAGIQGTVINWGFQNEPGVTLQLEGDTYSLSQISASDGRYDFRGLGQGYGILSPVLADSQAGLKLHTDDVAVLLHCDQQVVLNVGVYSGNQPPQPPSHLSVTAGGTKANPGDTIRFDITARNDLPTPISSVIITDLFPSPLKILSAQTSRGRVDILDNRMLSLSVGDMDSGEEVTITVEAQVNRWTPKGKQWENRTTLLYAESMADQVVSTITIGEGVSVDASDTDKGTQPRLIAVSDEMIDQTAEMVSALAVEEDIVPQPSPTEMTFTALSIVSESEPVETDAAVTVFSIEMAETPEALPTQAIMSAMSIEMKPTPAESPAVMVSALSVDMSTPAEISPALLISDTLSVDGRLPVTGLGLNVITLPALGIGLLGVAILAQILRRRSN